MSACLAIAVPIAGYAQNRVGSLTASRAISGQLDESKLHVLGGNTRPQANAANDLGRVADDFAMDHMLLELERPAAQKQELDAFIGELHDPASPNFHKWLTAEEFGARFGPAAEDIETVKSWLEQRGFTVNVVYPSGMTIDFSGTAGTVRTAFHTEIHRLNVDGVEHVANMSDPSIPEALAPAVAGVVSMHDFRPRAMKKAHPAYTFTQQNATEYAVTPGDLATIYNLAPLFTAKITGTGQTIAVLEDTDLYSSADWTTFRSTFGLSQYGGTLTTVHPAPKSGTNNCLDPGVPRGGDDGEAILDAEWAGAAAPGATIEVAACADTRTTFGGLIALQNLLSAAKLPSTVSSSYGECEAENGAASNAAFASVYAQAVTEGVSVFVAAGDEGAASCDAGASGATHGIGVSAFASTPYNVAAGGTDFYDTLSHTSSTYWKSTNTATYASALSYIPEIPWNDSCAGSLLAAYLGYTTVYGTSGFCGSTTASKDGLQVVAAGSGGPSGCATGAPSTAGVVSGSCQGYAKPAWQKGGDGVRDIPDVSMFAADGLWGHYYIYCWSDVREGGAACSGAPSNWPGAGGTSFSAPIWAGIQALVNQQTGSSWGNPNTMYYVMAANQGTCTNGGSCIFNSITKGDIDVNCSGTVDCYGAATVTTGGGRRGGGGPGGNTQSAANGALSTSSSKLLPAYPAGAGWNFATGLGSVNAYNLVTEWSKFVSLYHPATK
jgi:subtilase family serine protease